MNNVKNFVDTYFPWAFKIGLVVAILSLFFIFTNLTTEFYNTPKFLILVISLSFLLIIWGLKSLFEGKVTIRLTPLDLPLVLLLATATISALLSASPHISIFGTATKMDNSLSALLVYVLLYFVIVNSLKGKDVRFVSNVLLVGGTILSILAILSYAGVKLLPFSWTQIPNFTPTGSSFSTSAILALLLPFPLLSALKDNQPAKKLAHLILATVFGVALVLTGSMATWIAAGAAVILILLTNSHSSVKKNLAYLIIPIALVLLTSFLSYLPPKVSNPLYEKAQNFPREVQLPFPISWKISISAFRDSPLIGSGPSTYLYNFTQYKPLEFNSTKFWNIRFESAFNEYLDLLATLGGLGAIALILLTLMYLRLVKKLLPSQPSLAISGIVFFIILLLHPASLILWVVGVLILSLLMVSGGLTKPLHFRLGTYSQTSSSDLLPIILLIAILAGVGISGSYLGNFALADFHHRKALDAVVKNQGLEAYNSLINAEKLNPYNDLYRTDLAQTNFALANAIAASKGPTEASPGGSLTEEDKKNIQQFLQQAIAEGRVATTLSPKSAVNWEILGSIYKQISGVAQNATDFALDAYGRAIQLDPLNPMLRLNAGGIYYGLKNYETAARFFTDSVSLKPDFANGYYNLAVALKDKGDLENAKLVAEKVITLVKPDTQDYKLATEFLEDLKSRMATGSAEQSQVEAPAARETSPLQKTNQQKVLDLPEPENIASPPAVPKE